MSKNNFADAKKALENLGVWKYLVVFPKIDWVPKGELVKNIISLSTFESRE